MILILIIKIKRTYYVNALTTCTLPQPEWSLQQPLPQKTPFHTNEKHPQPGLTQVRTRQNRRWHWCYYGLLRDEIHFCFTVGKVAFLNWGSCARILRSRFHLGDKGKWFRLGGGKTWNPISDYWALLSWSAPLHRGVEGRWHWDSWYWFRGCPTHKGNYPDKSATFRAGRWWRHHLFGLWGRDWSSDASDEGRMRRVPQQCSHTEKWHREHA